MGLANGVYQVSVTLGDNTTARDQQGLYLEGEQVDTVTTAAGQFVTRTYLVTVTDGRLEVRLKDLGGADPLAVIDALEIDKVAP